jgi:PAS domain S-box-containing protein
MVDNIERLRQISSHLVDPEIAVLIFEALPDALLMVDGAGAIVLVNHQAELLFGYHRSELFDRAVEILVPDSRREAHIQHRSIYVLEPHPRAMGANLDLMAVRKDGNEFSVKINLSPIVTPQGIFTLAVVRTTR